MNYGTSRIDASLLADGLIDELRLWVMPVVVGSGQRLFEDTSSLELTPTDVHKLRNGSVPERRSTMTALKRELRGGPRTRVRTRNVTVAG